MIWFQQGSWVCANFSWAVVRMSNFESELFINTWWHCSIIVKAFFILSVWIIANIRFVEGGEVGVPGCILAVRKAILLSAYFTDLVKMKNLEAKLKQCSLLVCSLCARVDLYPLVLFFQGSVSWWAFVRGKGFSLREAEEEGKGCSTRCSWMC